MAMADALGQQTVDFSVLVKQAAEASFTNLKELCETSSELPDLERKIGLLKYILKTQQRLLRLLALSKWCRQVCYPLELRV
jgi:mediator of RNA polymerase II transcription subunit 14